MRCASLRTHAARAGKDVLERRRRSVLVVLATLTLGVALCIGAAAVQVRRFVQLHVRAHCVRALNRLLLCATECTARL